MMDAFSSFKSSYILPLHVRANIRCVCSCFCCVHQFPSHRSSHVTRVSTQRPDAERCTWKHKQQQNLDMHEARVGHRRSPEQHLTRQCWLKRETDHYLYLSLETVPSNQMCPLPLTRPLGSSGQMCRTWGVFWA
ncbi:hypothetical protein GOODEAATRI_025845 [Goodea atripinnis]|uniref:Uncharacterized protein n=1 Tax=Goodea atripinnis TaxID=208336 RepID=A0ABV0NXS2_9TELE